MASTTLNETPENPSRTVMGEGRGLSGDWPPGQQSLDKPVQSRTCPSSVSWSLPCFWHRSPLPPSVRQRLLPLPDRVCCGATEGLGLPRPPCSAHPRLSMQPFFAACGNPLPPAPLVLQIKPRVILVWAFCCLPLLRRAASQVEGTARGQDRHEGIKPRLSAARAAHRRAVCPFTEPCSQFAMIFFPLFAQGKGGCTQPHPGWMAPALLHPELSHSSVLSSGWYLWLCGVTTDPALSAQPHCVMPSVFNAISACALPPVPGVGWILAPCCPSKA